MKEGEIFLDWSPVLFLEDEKVEEDLKSNPPEEEIKVYYF